MRPELRKAVEQAITRAQGRWLVPALQGSRLEIQPARAGGLALALVTPLFSEAMIHTVVLEGPVEGLVEAIDMRLEELVKAQIEGLIRVANEALSQMKDAPMGAAEEKPVLYDGGGAVMNAALSDPEGRRIIS